MIDFRYHLVSLISVFLALAVGIVLGAGPLKEAIGDTLTGEVDDLRASASDLRTQLAASQAELADSQDAFAAVAPDLLAGTLEGRRIAIVEVGDAGDAVVRDVADRFVESGATVSATVRVLGEWTDPTRSSYRRALVGSIMEYLDPAPAVDAGTSGELAEALVQALTGREDTGADALSEDARVVLQLLVDGGLVEAEETITAPADAIVVIVGPDADRPEVVPSADATSGPTDDETTVLRETEDAIVEIALAADHRSEGVVVAGYGLADDGVLARLRSDDMTQRAVSTVAYVQFLVGEVGVPLALAQNIDGKAGHYGPDGDATAAVPPRTVLKPPQDDLTPDDGIAPGGDGSGTDESEPAATDPAATDPAATDPAGTGDQAAPEGAQG